MGRMKKTVRPEAIVPLRTEIRRRQLWRYLLAIAAVGVATAVRWGLAAWVGEGLPPYITFFPAISIVALVAGLGPGLLATVVAALAADYWFIPPVGHFAIERVVDGIGLGLFVAVGAFITIVAELYRRARQKTAAYELERVQAALRESENQAALAKAVQTERQRFFDVLETLPAMICLLTRDHHVAFANRAFREKFGESQGRHCYEYCFGRAEPCDFCESYKPLETGAAHHWEVSASDGSVIAAHDFPFTDADGSPMILEMDLDITEVRKAQAALTKANESLEARVAERTAALRESEERLRLLGDNLPESAVYQYVQETDGTARFLYFSAGIEQLNGVTAQEVLRDAGALHRQILPGLFEQLVEAEGRSARELSDFDMDVPMRRPDGEVRWMRLHSRPRRLVDGRVVWDGVQIDITERKRIDERLRQSEERFRSVLDNSKDLIYRQNLQTGRYEYISPSAVTVAGFSADEFLTMNVESARSRIHSDDMATVQSALARLQGAGHAEVEYRWQARSGDYRWFSNSMSLVKDSSGRLLYRDGSIRDITERKQADEALRLSEQKFALVFANNAAAIALTRFEDGRFLDVNDTWLEMTGYSRNEVIGRFARQMPIWPASEPMARFVQALRQNGSVRGWEQEFYRKSGELYVAQLSATLLRVRDEQVILSTLVDITERKRLEDAVRDSERQFRTLADSIPNLAWSANGDGYITWYNRQWYEYTGTTPEQMEGWGWQSVHDPKALPKVLERWKASIATGEPLEMEFPLRGADGRFRLFLTRVQPLKDAQGRVLRWFGTNTDVDELKRTEESLRQSEERVKLSLREKEVMLKEIHHRVKNNLQVIASLVDLQTNALADPALRGLFQDVRDRVRSMALVHEKLYQSDSLARVEFAGYARSLLSYLCRSHSSPASAIELKLDLQPVSLSVESAVPCGLILNELISNAFKHAFRGRSQGEVIAALGSCPDGRVFLRVSDNGVGLPAGTDWRQSRSLGLRLIHLLAGQLDASVEVRTDGGTEFKIAFAPEKTEEKH